MNLPIVNFASLVWDESQAGVKCKEMVKDGRRLRLVEFDRSFVELDWCRKGHIGFVLDGELEIEFDNHTVVAKHGDGIFIPPGELSRHKAKVRGETVRLILVEDV